MPIAQLKGVKGFHSLGFISLANICAGPGHFKRNKSFQLVHMKNNGSEMYQEVSQIIRKALCELLANLPGLFATSSAEILTQIQKEISIFFEQNSSTGSRTSTKKHISQAKIKLQKALDISIGELTKAWVENIEFKAEKPFDMSTLDFQNDGRFNINELRGDGDYNPGDDDDD